MTTAFVGLGANLGDPQRMISEAMRELERLPRSSVTGRSSLYRSAPIGHAPQPDFVNAVVRIDTELAPDQLLGELQAIEARHGRERSFANAPRTLDLDLLLYGEAALATPQLTLPHPRMHGRAFVLRPLLDIAPGIEIPGHGLAHALLSKLKDQEIERIGHD